jgi:hypothetical protein
MPDFVNYPLQVLLFSPAIVLAMNWRSTRKVLAVFLASALTSACNVRQPSTDWSGTWKLNPAKSGYQGPVFTISISADGEYRFDGNSSRTLRCDGKDRPIGNNRTGVCVKSGDTVLDIIQKENGVKTSATHDEISTDGKVFTTTVTEFRPNGPVVTSRIVFSRLSGSNDFAGKWRDTSDLQQHTNWTMRLDNQTLHIDYPSAGQHIEAPLDGAEATVHGPLDGMTYALRVVGRRKFLTVTKRNGRVLNQGSLVLSRDGRVITDSWWNPDRPNDVGTFVYEKE